MVQPLKIALAQVAASPAADENLTLAEEMTRRAKMLGADLVVFPEMCMAIPGDKGPLTDLAEPVQGPFVSGLAVQARQHGLWVIAGFWERIPNDQRVWNSAVVLSGTGEAVEIYRKLHLFDALNVTESDRIAPGNVLPRVFEVNRVRIGIAICYDLRFPELFRYLAAQGAELVVVLAGWYSGAFKEDHWLTLLRARAIENTLYVAGVNQTGGPFCGRSSVFDPFGVPCVGAGERPELLVTEVSPERVAEVRSRLPSLSHCRTDLFPG